MNNQFKIALLAFFLHFFKDAAKKSTSEALLLIILEILYLAESAWKSTILQTKNPIQSYSIFRFIIYAIFFSLFV